MPTYIMLTRLTAYGSQSLTQDPDRLSAVNEEVQSYGCRVLAQYATIGPYDFVNIIDAPDNETIAVLSAALSSRGTVSILTMPAVGVGQFVDKLKTRSDTVTPTRRRSRRTDTPR